MTEEKEISWKALEKAKSDIFRELQSRKLDSLNDIISEINELISEREGLSTEMEKKANDVKTKINNFILEARDVKLSEKIPLKQKEVELEEFKIKEKIDAWKDIARLKEELRGFVKEAKERQTRAEILDEFLD